MALDAASKAVAILQLFREFAKQIRISHVVLLRAKGSCVVAQLTRVVVFDAVRCGTLGYLCSLAGGFCSYCLILAFVEVVTDVLVVD